MKNICVIPGFNRPEFLELCLEHIKEAELSKDILFMFCLDFGFNRKYLDIIANFSYEKIVIERPDNNFTLGKLSFNVLSGLLEAGHLANEVVFYIEEDFFITKDFFKYHYAVLNQQPDILCSVGTIGVHNPTKDKNAYYLDDKHYACWGTAWHKEKIIKYLMPYYEEEYFKNPYEYIIKNFPNSKVSKKFTEQAGLTHRIMENYNLKCAFSHVPRCYHAGFYGKNQENPQKLLSYEEKLNKLKSVCYDEAALIKNSKHRYNTADLNTNEDKFFMRELL